MHNKIAHAFAIALTISWLSIGAVTERPVAATPLSNGVTAFLPFVGSATPRYATGTATVNADGVTVNDQGATTTKEHCITIPLAGNFVRKAGSVSFWVKPSWKPADPSVDLFRGLLGTDNFGLNYQPSNHCLFFMTGKTRPVTGYGWDYACVDPKVMAGWKANQWYHVALTWNASSGVKALFLDGKLAASNSTDLIRDDAVTGNETLTLGGPDAAGCYKELVVWSRSLKAEEIARLASAPEECAHELQQALPQIKRTDAWPVSIEMAQPRPYADLIVEPGKQFSATVPVTNPTAVNWSGTIALSLLDFHEVVRSTQSFNVDLSPGTTRNIEVTFNILERGIFKIRAAVSQDGKTWRRDVVSFAAWPPPTSPPPASSFFGNHVNAWSHDMLGEAARLGQGWERDHNMLQSTWMNRVEPDKGEWAFKNDFQLDAVKACGMPVLGQLFGTPYWAAASGTLPKPTGDTYPFGARPDLAAFREYVSRTVSHFKSSIHVWEIWNEPEVSMFWNGSPEQFAETVETACASAKEADPTCTVLQGGYTSDAWKWHELAAKAGAFRHADGISMHYYYNVDDSPETNFAHLHATIDHFKQLARTYGKGKQAPIWNSECGIGSTSWLTGLDGPNLPPEAARPAPNWRRAAIRQVEFDAQQQALGVVRSFDYLQNIDGGSPYYNTSTLEMTGAPKPDLMARVAMAAQVDGWSVAGVVRRPEARFWSIVYQRPQRKSSLALCWVGDGGKARIGLVPIDNVVDLMGNAHAVPKQLAVTDEPCYVTVHATASTVIAQLWHSTIEVIAKPNDQSNVGTTGSLPLLPDYPAPKEDPQSNFTVNLRPYANMGFYDAVAGDGKGGWADEGPLNCLSSMPTGRQTFFAVPFDIIDPATNNGRSIVTLRGTNATPTFQRSTNGIGVGGKCVRALYFLHSAVWASTPSVIGCYVIHYADKSSLKIPIAAGSNTGDWWSAQQPGEISKPVPVTVTNTADGKPATRYVRVWEWQNPRRDEPIVSLDFTSCATNATPILIAISGVK